MKKCQKVEELYEGTPSGKRPRGKTVTLDFREWRIRVTQAQDRDRWLAAVDQAKGSYVRLVC